MEFWSTIGNIFSPPKTFWTTEECAKDPIITDRVIFYLINYFDSPSVARKAVRLFLGIDDHQFCDWNEVRVATLREIEEALKSVGGGINTWELAVTIKDFLQNAIETIDTVDIEDGLNDLKPGEVNAYLKQLRGSPEAWKKGQSSPFRPNISMFYKHCLKYRKVDEAILPENAIHYLEYLLGRTNKAPFEFYSNRMMVRLGIFKEQDEVNSKIVKFNDFIGEERPINKHRQLVQFGKTICISTPRCNICPLATECHFPKAQNSVSEIPATGTESINQETSVATEVESVNQENLTQKPEPEEQSVTDERNLADDQPATVG